MKVLISSFFHSNPSEMCVDSGWGGLSMEVVSSFLVVGKDGCDVKCIRSRLLLNIHSIYPNSTTTTSEAGRENCQCVKKGKN